MHSWASAENSHVDAALGIDILQLTDSDKLITGFVFAFSLVGARVGFDDVGAVAFLRDTEADVRGAPLLGAPVAKFVGDDTR